jgi:hypothetical protein
MIRNSEVPRLPWIAGVLRLARFAAVWSSLFLACHASAWELIEVYSNADGTIQFVVHSTQESGQQYLAGKSLVVQGNGVRNAYVFPNDLPGDSAGRSFLVATQGFADLQVLRPDYVVPNGFFPRSASIVMVAGHGYGYRTLPADGSKAYWQDPDAVSWYATPIAINFEGERYAFLPATSATGSWFDPKQSGHGFMLEALPGTPPRLFAGWFTFTPQGGQAWITGVGPIDGNRAVVRGYQMLGGGGRFPPNFDAVNVHPQDWGTLSFTFSDCDHGRVEWMSSVSGYGSGGMDLTRLTRPAGLIC